jgi:hypothetical protein
VGESITPIRVRTWLCSLSRTASSSRGGNGSAKGLLLLAVVSAACCDLC